MGERSTAQIAAYALAIALLVIGGVRYLGDRDEAPASPAVAIDGAGTDSGEVGDTGAGAGDELYVHVAGAVRREGLYRLPAGSRAEAAVERAGGLRPSAELRGVNLAAELQDGQQITVPKRGEAPPPGSLPSSSAASAGTPGAGAQGGTPISLASATPEQLDAGVEGIGPTLAARIVEYRDQNGGFESIDELRQVEGIGEARFSALREAVGP